MSLSPENEQKLKDAIGLFEKRLEQDKFIQHLATGWLASKQNYVPQTTLQDLRNLLKVFQSQRILGDRELKRFEQLCEDFDVLLTYYYTTKKTLGHFEFEDTGVNNG